MGMRGGTGEDVMVITVSKTKLIETAQARLSNSSYLGG